MPRQPRKKSNTGIYHIMLRGINRQSLFEDDHDRYKFVRILDTCREEAVGNERIRMFDVYAWVIMGNHVHLVLRFLGEDSSMQHVMKRICVAYAYYYNQKNERIGPVFQDRYRSEPIEDERYLFNVVRYVHMNPVKAGMCDDPIEYSWSSYREYMHKKSVAGIVDRETVLEKMRQIEMVQGENTNLDSAEFEKWTIEKDDGAYLEICHERKKTISDDTAREEMKKYGCNCIEDFRELDYDKKVSCIRSMLGKGAGISQVSRITGISRPTIYKMNGTDRGTVLV